MDLDSKKSCLFLDRDGVINRHPSTHYVLDWTGFQFCEGALSAIALLSSHFQYIVVVTNQQGVGKGLMTQQSLDEIHHRMTTAILAFGGRVDHIQACTELASVEGNCRKPSPAMAMAAKDRFPEIDFSQSCMVGDQLTDMKFGLNLNMHCALIRNKHKEVTLPPTMKDILQFDSLLKFAQSLNS